MGTRCCDYWHKLSVFVIDCALTIRKIAIREMMIFGVFRIF